MRVLSAGPDPELLMSNTGEDRKPGLHLSDILVRLAWERDKKYNPDEPKDLMVFEQGHTWETILEQALSARHKRPGYRPDAIQEDGVWMSPDHVNPDSDVQVEEWKSTRKSSKNLDGKIAEWLPQAKSYVRALMKQGTAKVPVIRFRVWCMMGDWSFESKGDLTLLRDYYRVDIEFDKRELEENWKAVLSAGRRFGLLKEAPEWEPRSQSKPRRSSSKEPLKSRGTARVVTFPRTRTSLKPPSAS